MLFNKLPDNSTEVIIIPDSDNVLFSLLTITLCQINELAIM